jgi:hypothetical protein
MKTNNLSTNVLFIPFFFFVFLFLHPVDKKKGKHHVSIAYLLFLSILYKHILSLFLYSLLIWNDDPFSIFYL